MVFAIAVKCIFHRFKKAVAATTEIMVEMAAGVWYTDTKIEPAFEDRG